MWGIGEVSAQGEPLIWFAGFVVSGVDFAEDKVSVSVRVLKADGGSGFGSSFGFGTSGLQDVALRLQL